MSQTYDQLSLRVHSMTEQLVGTIFKPMLDELKPLLIAYHTFLVELRESEHDGHAIGGIFQLFGKIITFVGIQLIKAARAIHKFAAEHPMLVKVLATLVVVGAALTSAIGAGIVMIATIGGAVAAFASAWPMIAMVAETLTTALAGVVPYVVAMAAVGAVLYAAWSHDFGGIRTLLSNVALVVQGLWEAFHHWGYSTVTISAQTGQALANAGILDFFINLVSWIARGIQWARGLWDSLKTGWATVAPVLHAAWVTLSDAFSHLSIILSHTFDHITGIGNAAATTFETSHDKGARFGRILNTLIIPAIEFFAKAIRGVAWVVENVVIPVVNRMITFFQDATDWVHHHSDTVRIALEVITAALGVFAVMGIGSAVAALGSLVVAGAAAIPAVLGLMAPFLVAAAPILATVAAIVAVVEAIRQISALVTELNRQGFQETWRLITGSAPDLDAMRAHHRGVDASDPVTGSSGVHHNEDVPTPARSVIPTADGLTPSTSPPTVSGPTASGDGAGQNSSSHATATAINNMTRVLQQVHVSTQEQTQLMRSGALRPVIGEQAIAVAVENYSSSEGERSGYLGRPRLGSGM